MKSESLDICIYSDIFPAVNVADLDIIEGAVGPGRRLGIWLQGCLKRCPGCINQSFRSIERNRIVSIEELLEKTDSSLHLDGITLSGGEPVLQTRALLPFLEEVHQRNLSVVCYTGYRLEELKTPDVPKELKQFLALIDLLIDGEYRSELPRGDMYCASSNQRLHFFTNRIRPQQVIMQPESVFSFGQTQVKRTGILADEIYFKLLDKLGAYGIHLENDDDKERSFS